MHQHNTTTPVKPVNPFQTIITSTNPSQCIKWTFPTNDDPSKNCPLNNKPHPLKKCRMFRNKLLHETSGKRAEGFQIEPLDGKVVICLPPLLECHEIFNNQLEIPTPSTVLHQPHLPHIAKHIPELDPEAEILLLLGRDVLRAHKVRQQVSGPHNDPFAQRLDIGWVGIGEVCLGNVHKRTVSTFKTNVLEGGRILFFSSAQASYVSRRLNKALTGTAKQMRRHWDSQFNPN